MAEKRLNKAVRSMLNEHTGGFIIFYVDYDEKNKTNCISIDSEGVTGNEILELAFQKFFEKMVKYGKIQESSDAVINIADEIRRIQEDDEEDEDDDTI